MTQELFVDLYQLLADQSLHAAHSEMFRFLSNGTVSAERVDLLQRPFRDLA